MLLILKVLSSLASLFRFITSPAGVRMAFLVHKTKERSKFGTNKSYKWNTCLQCLHLSIWRLFHICKTFWHQTAKCFNPKRQPLAALGFLLAVESCAIIFPDSYPTWNWPCWHGNLAMLSGSGMVWRVEQHICPCVHCLHMQRLVTWLQTEVSHMTPSSIRCSGEKIVASLYFPILDTELFQEQSTLPDIMLPHTGTKSAHTNNNTGGKGWLEIRMFVSKNLSRKPVENQP